MNIACTKLFKSIRTISPAVDSALNGLRAESLGADVLRTQVDELLPLKNKIDELRKRVKEIKRAITEVLSNDADLQMMYLCGYVDSTSSTRSSSDVDQQEQEEDGDDRYGFDIANGFGMDNEGLELGIGLGLSGMGNAEGLGLRDTDDDGCPILSELSDTMNLEVI